MQILFFPFLYWIQKINDFSPCKVFCMNAQQTFTKFMCSVYIPIMIIQLFERRIFLPFTMSVQIQYLIHFKCFIFKIYNFDIFIIPGFGASAHLFNWSHHFLFISTIRLLLQPSANALKIVIIYCRLLVSLFRKNK